MKFGAPLWLIVLPALVLGLVALWVWSARRAQVSLRRAFNTPLLARLIGSVNTTRRWLKRGLFATGIAFLVVGLARPQWGQKEVEIELSGVDLVIALDVSRSMLGVDVDATNRLSAATTAIEQLLRALGGDRVGLIVFAGEAFVAAPLTRDHVAVERALSSAGPAIVSEQGSNLGEAIQRAKECFDRAAIGPRTLLVVSDGEQLQGDAVEAARKALREGIRVHTAGVGSATGARVPLQTTTPPEFVRNSFGREVISRRDEQRLTRIASAGGGLYTRIEDNHSRALVEWFHRAAATASRTTEKRVVKEPAERFQWPLALAFAILTGEWMLGDRRRKQ